MKLIREIHEEINLLTEEKENGKKEHFIEGVFMQAEARNRNGRIYPLHVLQKEVMRYVQEIVQTGRALGELNHPDGPTINLERVSHIVKSLKQEGPNFIGRAKILTETTYGKIVKSLLSEGVKLGVSSRGMGSLVSRRDGVQEVQEDFYLCAIDIVADPSAPEAFVNGVLESKEWVWDNGIIKEKDLVDIKKDIQKSSSRELQEKKIKAFDTFLKKLIK